MSNFIKLLFNLLRKPGQPPVLTDTLDEPAQIINSKVLMIVYDPIMDPVSGQTLSQQQNWYRASDMVTTFMNDILQVSGGLARYQIVQRLDVKEFPAKTDGFRYTPQTYLDVLRGITPPHKPQEANYDEILTKYKLLVHLAKGEIDEVWVFAFPHAGFFESTMGGPAAFWCNAPPLKNSAAAKRLFVIMGFSYERQVGEMLESFGHRAESIMLKTHEKLTGEANLWQQFTRYDKIAPGQAACGNIHFAPNSLKDYDWNNPTLVKSNCYDWLLNYPNFKGDVRTVNASEWGSGDIRAHHLWWLNHFPKTAGRRNGIHNNWWQYIVDPNRLMLNE
jgi:hypothetical protein